MSSVSGVGGVSVHAFADDALGRDDAVGVAERIRGGGISAREAVEAAVRRIEQVDPQLNAVQVAAFEQALAAAEQPALSGAFAGVPCLIKDNVDVAGLPTGYGSAAFTPRPATRHAPPVEQLLAQGVVVLGKTTMPEFGLSASTEYGDGRPPTRNPWNPQHSVGASSGGSAAIVAAGAVPIAHANDGGGSIRIPAACNGLVGLKPTRGRLRDQAGANLLPLNIAAEGVVTRSVRDTAHHLAAMEQTFRRSSLPPVGLVEGPGVRRLRIGVVTATPATDVVDPEVVATARAAAELLAGLGHEPLDVALPIDARFVGDFRTYWEFFAVALTGQCMLHHGRAFSRSRLDPFTRAMAAAGLRGVDRWPAAIHRLRQVSARDAAMFADVDVLLSPVVTTPPPPIGFLDPSLPFEECFARTTAFAGFTPLQNATGGPAIALPYGMTAAGLPAAVHLAGPRGAERALLELAYEIEAAHPFPRIG